MFRAGLDQGDRPMAEPRQNWKAKLADITWVEAVVILVIFFTSLAVLDSMVPVDLFGAVTRWLDALVGMAASLIREVRGTAGA